MPNFFDTTLLQKTLSNEINFKSISDEKITLTWQTFLDFLGLGDLLKNFPVFDAQYEFYKMMIEVIEASPQDDVYFDLFDQLFVDCLTHIKAIPEINANYLLGELRSKDKPDYLADSLLQWELALTENPKNFLHDLTLYLGWDRVCVRMAILFESVPDNIPSRNWYSMLKGCLAESFQHISRQGRTIPSFVRLQEALFAYDMRDDNLQKHPEVVWEILSKGALSLSSRERIAELAIIDRSITEKAYITSGTVFCADSEEKLIAGWNLARHYLNMLQFDYPVWDYHLAETSFTFVKGASNNLSIQEIILKN